MKLIAYILAFSLTSLNIAIAQTTRTVNNAPGSQAQYSTINAAIDAASPGDIILVQGSGINYGPINLTKRLAIIGTGYFLNQNGVNTQATGGTAEFGVVSFNAGSEGSIFTGFKFSDLNTATGNIIVSRCQFVNTGVFGTSVANFVIKQCFCNGSDLRGGHFILKNNIMLGGLYMTAGEAINNIINRDNQRGHIYHFSNAVSVRNNIFGNSQFVNGATNPPFQVPNEGRFHNVFCDINVSGYVSGGNIVGADFNSLFVSGDNSLDGRYRLSANSVARGAGDNATDCGAFGGDEPYVPSGIPFIPNIYELTVPNVGTSGSGIRVTIKAKTNN